MLGRTSSTIGYASMGRLVVLAAFAVVTLLSWLTKWQPSRFDPRPAKSAAENRAARALDVAATRDPGGIEITNRESRPLGQCVVGIPDRGRSNQWTTVVQELPPTQTATLTWSQFRSPAGAEMPADTGQNARYAVVTCASHRTDRKAAVLPFR